MTVGGRKRIIFFITLITATALTSTALGQVIISNTYTVYASPSVPEVNLTVGNSSYSSITVTTNSVGSSANVNLTEFFTYPSNTQKNLSNILFMQSRTSGDFYFTVNVTNFTGYSHITNLTLYSVNSTGGYVQDFSYSNASGNTTSSIPVAVTPGTSTALGLNLSVGKKDLGPSVWNLDLQINGYFTGLNSSKVVFVQYYVHFLITTTEGV